MFFSKLNSAGESAAEKKVQTEARRRRRCVYTQVKN